MAGRLTPVSTTRRRVRPLRLAFLRALAAAARVTPAELAVLLTAVSRRGPASCSDPMAGSDPMACSGLSVEPAASSVRLGGFRLALDGSGTGGGGRWLTGRRRLRVGEAGGPGGHVVIGELGRAVVAELGQVVIAAFGECEPAAVSPARRDGRVTGVGPGRRRIRQAFLGLPGPRRRRRRLVPGRKLRLRIPGTGITGQRRVTTGRIAPGPAGRAPRCGRACRPGWAARCLSPGWGARPLPGCGAFPWRGRGTDMALTGGTSPGLASRVCPARAGPALSWRAAHREPAAGSRPGRDRRAGHRTRRGSARRHTPRPGEAAAGQAPR